MAGISAREISTELIGSGTMSSEMPNEAIRSRNRERPSTDQASSILAEGRRLQMLLTPKAAKARSRCVGIAVLRADFHPGLRTCRHGGRGRWRLSDLRRDDRFCERTH